MMKKLLFALFAVLCSTGVFAHEAGDYVYTSTQRFMLTGANLLTNGNFDDASYAGWTNVEGGTIDAEAWSLEDGMGPDGGRAVISQGADKNGSLCQTLAVEPGQTYVVSFWVKGETLANTTTIQAFVNMDGTLIKGTNSAETPVITVLSSLNYAADWKEVAGVVVVDDSLSTKEGTPTLVINLTALPTNVQVANFSVNTAAQVFDIRGIQSQVAFAKTLMDDANFNVPAAEAARAQLAETIETIEGMISAGELDDMDAGAGAVAGFEEQFEEFLSGSSTNMSTLIPGLDIASLSGWGRGGQYSANYKLDLWGGNWGHLTDEATKDELRAAIQTSFTNTATYNAFHEDFPAGKYFFTAEIRNANTGRTSWPTEPVFNLEMDGCKMFIANDTIDLPTIAGEEYQRFYMIGEVKEDGAFRAGVYWPGPGEGKGGCFFIKSTMVRAFDFDIPAKVDHIQAWKKFIAQWDAATNNYNGVNEKLADANYPWANDSLRSAKAVWDPFYLAQVAKGWVTADDKDAGVASTEELNDWALYQGVELYSEEGARLEYQVVRGYQNAINYVVAANKPFTDLAEAIDEAKKTRNSGANLTGDRDAYKAAILKAIAAITEIRNNTSDATREADTEKLAAVLDELNAATEAFLASVTNAPVVDIDFSNNFEEVVPEEGEGYYKIAGVAGEMHFGLANVQLDNTVADWNFALGFNGELNDVLHVGGSSYGTVTLPVELTDDDALKVTFDLWYGQLGKGFLDIDLLNAAGVRVAGFSYDCYNKNMSYNDFDDASGKGMNFKGKEKSNHDKSGGAASICTTALTNSFELNIDYKSGTVQGKMVNAFNTVEGAAIPMPMPADGDNKITTFRVGSSTYQKANSGASGRRCWFDNLKISKFSSVADMEEDITESPWAAVDGIEMVAGNVKAHNNNAIYNLMGVRVNKAQKGLYIINGKKYVVK